MNSVKLHGAFLLRDITTGQSGLHASDEIILKRKATFDDAGQLVITDIQLREGAEFSWWLAGISHAVYGAADATNTPEFGDNNIAIADGNLCISGKTVAAAQAADAAPAVVTPYTDTNATVSKELIVFVCCKAHDLGVL